MAASRLFLDTNVLVSGLLFQGAEATLLLAPADLGPERVTSAFVLGEARRVLRDKFGLSPAHIDAALAALPLTTVAEAPADVLDEARELLRDVNDAPVLAAAWAAAATHLVTGDHDLLVLTPEAARLAVVGARELV